jgi:dTDP-4-amino-4,6-dideoxygalactose transaminase
MMQVPFLDLRAQHQSVKNEILPLWQEILETAAFIGGKHVAALEEEFAAACGVRHAVAVSNGTDALVFIFKALGVKPGDEVIVPANTFIATSEAVSIAGGKVVFVDVRPDTYNIAPALIEAAVTPRTKGIVPVHLYGQCADMDPILALAEKRRLWVVEDAAQAHLAEYKGRKAGSMGVAAEFSFYPGKNMGACGDAGAVVTNAPALAEKVRMLRDHGSRVKYYHDFEGHNGRCDALQAAALRIKLKHLPAWNEARRAVATKYLQRLTGVKGVILPAVADGCLPVWHLFVVQVDNRDAVVDALKERGIATGLHYPVPLHLQKAYAHLGPREGAFPVTEAYSRRLLSLPMFAEMTDEQTAYVCDNLKAIVAG